MYVRGEEVVKVTHMKKGSGRHIGEIVIGIACILVSLFFGYLFIQSLLLPFTAPTPNSIFEWLMAIFGYILLIMMSFGGMVLLFYLGKYQLTIKPQWKFTLFENEIIAHLIDDEGKELHEKVIPIQHITQCVIMRREQRQTIRLKQNAFYRYYFFLGAHVYYTENDEEKLISFEDPNDLEKLNEAVQFLRDKHHIPLSFTHAVDLRDTSTHGISKLVEMYPPERLTRPFHLKQLDKANYNVSIMADTIKGYKANKKSITEEVEVTSSEDDTMRTDEGKSRF